MLDAFIREEVASETRRPFFHVIFSFGPACVQVFPFFLPVRFFTYGV